MAFNGETWIYDLTWIPDPETYRLMNGLRNLATDSEVLLDLWSPSSDWSKTTDLLDPRACRAVSIAAVVRSTKSDRSVTVKLYSYPDDLALESTNHPENALLRRFFSCLKHRRPELVTFNTTIPSIGPLVHRAVAQGIRVPGIDDTIKHYLTQPHMDDTMCHLRSYTHSSGALSLNSIAALSGIPSAPSCDLRSLHSMWSEGYIEGIVQRNERSVITSYLIWLRMSHFLGRITSVQYEAEREYLRDHLVRRSLREDAHHLRQYLEEWTTLEQAHAGRQAVP